MRFLKNKRVSKIKVSYYDGSINLIFFIEWLSKMDFHFKFERTKYLQRIKVSIQS
jgi:hypothetical protein